MIIDIDAAELGAQLAAAYEAVNTLAVAIVETLRPTIQEIIQAVQKTRPLTGGMNERCGARRLGYAGRAPHTAALAYIEKMCYTVSMDTKDRHGYRHKNGSVSLVRYHFVWIPRRRRKVLVDAIADRLHALILEKADELNLEVLRFAIQPDHVHLFVVADPDLAPSTIVGRLKGFTSRILRAEFPELLKMPSLWTSSFFVSTAGNVSADTIQRYIQAQSTRA
jgi:putative transposase